MICLGSKNVSDHAVAYYLGEFKEGDRSEISQAVSF
jgi:hypothetical protein